MKSLSQHISEKLIINKNYKNVDDIKTLFDNVDFIQQKYLRLQGLFTNKDIFSMTVDYIRDHNVRSFSDFDSYKKTAIEDKGTCLAVFNNRIKDICIFQKMSDTMYNNVSIFKIKKYVKPLYQFDKYEVGVSAFHVLKNTKTWNNVDEVEYYEISEETFEGISKLYDELFDKLYDELMKK